MITTVVILMLFAAHNHAGTAVNVYRTNAACMSALKHYHHAHGQGSYRDIGECVRVPVVEE